MMLRTPVRLPDGTLAVSLTDMGEGRGMTHARTLAVGGCLIQSEALRQEAALRAASRAAQAATSHADRERNREAYNAAQRRYYARRRAAGVGL